MEMQSITVSGLLPNRENCDYLGRNERGERPSGDETHDEGTTSH